MTRSRARKAAPRKRAAEAGARGGEPPAESGGRKRRRASAPGTRDRAAATPVPAAAAASPEPLIRLSITVRWRDLDAFNHVNNASYLTYIEEARLRWMQSLSGPWVDAETAPVLAAVQLNYRRPIEWPQELMVELFAERLGNSSLTLGHRIAAAGDAGIVFCDGHSVMVWIDRRGGKAAALPDAVRTACAG